MHSIFQMPLKRYIQERMDRMGVDPPGKVVQAATAIRLARIGQFSGFRLIDWLLCPSQFHGSPLATCTHLGSVPAKYLRALCFCTSRHP